MSDTGDMWRSVKDDSRKRKWRNLEFAMAKMDELRIKYKTKNGIHFTVEGKIDYWPSTGKFIVRQGKKSGRGIHALIRELGL